MNEAFIRSVFVPVGENCYRTREDFQRVNKMLPRFTVIEIYENMILSDNWKQLRPEETDEPEDGCHRRRFCIR
ncbi:MAG: hypothetical protein CW338_01070 [Clostridiales bacterium]|nr:hypothetical protein [Clostridiales bacterium]